VMQQPELDIDATLSNLDINTTRTSTAAPVYPTGSDHRVGLGSGSATQTPRFCLGTVITVATVITRGQANSDH
jgi:hypothetical protein